MDQKVCAGMLNKYLGEGGNSVTAMSAITYLTVTKTPVDYTESQQ